MSLSLYGQSFQVIKRYYLFFGRYFPIIPTFEYKFDISDELRSSGYAIKPIAGRCGDNIGLIGECDTILDETSGQFDKQENIYQQLWCLPNVAGRFIQVCTFTVGGHYGGACLRSDPSLVIKKIVIWSHYGYLMIMILEKPLC